MRKAIMIKVENLYVSNETGQPVNITSMQFNIDYFNHSGYYSFVQIYTKLAELKAKTLRQLNDDAWKFAEQNNLGYDFELYIFQK